MFVAGLGALAVLAAACGDGDGVDERAEAPATTQPQTDTSPDPDTGDGDGTGDGETPATTTEAPTTTTEAPTTTTEPPPPPPSGPPHVAELRWGNFELADRIAAKLEAGEALNFVLSLAATGEDAHFVESFELGWSQAAAEVSDEHGVEVNDRIIGPNRFDADAQAEAIESLIATADIDCLAVQASGPRLLTDVIDAAAEAGVPVFAVGGDSPDAKRIAYYGIDDYGAGLAAGQNVGQWAADGGILVRRAGVLTGDAGDQRSFDMMRGFIDGLLEIHSGVEFINSPSDTDSLGYEPVSVYDQVEAWVLENIDVDIVFHTDSGLQWTAQVIADQLLYGDMYAAGFHINQAVTDYIRERVVVAAMVPHFTAQAHQAGMACGDFLLAGAFEDGHIVTEPTIVTGENVDETDWTAPENQ